MTEAAVKTGSREVWRPVAGWSGVYSVSSKGRVRRDESGRILISCPDRDGYPQVCLCRGGVRTSRRIHTLVALSFIGPPPTSEHEVNHVDGVKGDNRPGNLEWVTHPENMSHASTRGLMRGRRGELSSTAKLKRGQVEDILRRLIDTDETIDELALAIFGSKAHTYYMRIYRIATRAQWKNIPCDETALTAAVKRKKYASRYRDTTPAGERGEGGTSL